MHEQDILHFIGIYLMQIYLATEGAYPLSFCFTFLFYDSIFLHRKQSATSLCSYK